MGLEKCEQSHDLTCEEMINYVDKIGNAASQIIENIEKEFAKRGICKHVLLDIISTYQLYLMGDFLGYVCSNTGEDPAIVLHRHLELFKTHISIERKKTKKDMH